MYSLYNRKLGRLIKADMAGANRIVFRKTAEMISAQQLAARLLNAISEINPSDPGSVLDALILAGQTECALSDSSCVSAASAAQITDVLSSALVGEECNFKTVGTLARGLGRDSPAVVRISHPEGFSYYALHPGDFADATADMDRRTPVAVVGIRSIGTTLSAVTCAALRKRGVRTSRITVRPAGHPYDRTTRLDEGQRHWLRKQQLDAAKFMIVDEGPGLSGSSFLSAAEALMQEGVPAESITLLGTRDVDPGQLCAQNATSRWQRLAWRKVPSRISQRFKDCTSLSGGVWRELFLNRRAQLPPYWPEMECAKFWSPDRMSVFKFDGLGWLGSQVRHRSQIIHEAGFGPSVDNAADGMSCYEFVAGRVLDPTDLSTLVLDRIAEYCAFRISEFRSHGASDGSFDEMVRFNFSQEMGRDWPFMSDTFGSHREVIADGRMAPHEWIECAHGRLVKVDGSRHGDDHFFPGPTDIAWDLAGAIVEWNMQPQAERYFLQRFHEMSGVTPDNVPAFQLAYSVFRASYCTMASMATGVESEKSRLQRAHSFYREKIEASLKKLETIGVI